jgi:choline-sulfatase
MRERPNILLITDDQHRFDFFGDTGVVPSLQTPALDRLRREGAVLSNAFSVCPICVPARFAWCHGLYPSQASRGLMCNNADWPQLPSMPQALQQAGYRTAVIGKVHAHSGLKHIDLISLEHELLARGYDEACEVSGKSLAYWRTCRWTEHLSSRDLLDSYLGEVERRCSQLGGRERYEPGVLGTEDYVDGFIGERAVKWLETYHRPEPFFLHVSFCGPHFPLDPPEEFFRRHHPENMPVPAGLSDPDEIAHYTSHRAMHAAMIEMIDRQTGRLLDQLKARGMDANTVVLFTTDHGDMIGDLGYTHKSLPYDGSCRTPVTVWWPGVIAPGRREALVESVDLPVTLLDLAGCEGKASDWLPQTPGRSFLPYLRGECDDHRGWTYAEVDTWAGKAEYTNRAPFPISWRMCCERDWKYIRHKDGREELYDRQNDPSELDNLVDQPAQAERVSRMRSQLIQSMFACVAPDRKDAVTIPSV